MNYVEAMKQALEKATKVMEDACIRVDELKAENESLRQAIAEAEKQEPVAWKTDDIELYVREDKFGFYNIPLYTRPQPKREWVGLSEKERMEFIEMYAGINPNLELFTREIEAKLKEKNT